MTDSTNAIVQYVLMRLRSAAEGLGLQGVWLGDQNLMPTTPNACVIPGPTNIELAGANRYSQWTFEVFVLVYHGKIQETQQAEEECMQLAEALTLFLNKLISCKGLLVHSMVTAIEPGYSERNNAMYRTSRITLQGYSRITLPLEEE
jgi:hypothetical protein